MKNVLNREVLPKDSPIILGFFHFLITAVIGYIVLIPLFSMFGLFLIYSSSDIILGLMFLIVVSIAASISTFLLKKNIVTKNKLMQVLLWSLIFALPALVSVQGVPVTEEEIVNMLVLVAVSTVAYIGASVATMKMSMQDPD